MLILRGDVEQERTKLEQAVQGNAHVTLFVLGDSAQIQKIAKMAETRAKALPRVRQAIWITDPQILTPESRTAYGLDDAGVVVSVLNPDGQVVKQLDQHEAASPLTLERAFLAGEKN